MRRVKLIDLRTVVAARRLASVALLLVASLPVPALAQAKAADKAADFTELERVVREELQATATPGAAVAVLSGGRVLFAKGFGVASVETGAPVTPDMILRLGSTTKMLPGAAPGRRAVVASGESREHGRTRGERLNAGAA